MQTVLPHFNDLCEGERVFEITVHCGQYSKFWFKRPKLPFLSKFYLKTGHGTKRTGPQNDTDQRASGPNQCILPLYILKAF